MWTSIELDRINVALMRLGRTAALDFESTESNLLYQNQRAAVFSREDVNQHGLLDKIRPLLESLRRSYKRIENFDRANPGPDGLIRGRRRQIAEAPP